MNSLDKMEDYDRLKQERDELAALVEVMRDEFRDFATNYDCDADAHKYGTRCMVCVSQKALSITPSAALREIKARTLEEITDGKSEEDDISVWYIRELAAAKRKGE